MLQKHHWHILLTTTLLVVGCQYFDDSDDSDDGEVVDVSHITAENYPQVDGSTSAHPLQVIIACNILDIEYDWFPSWDGTLRVLPSNEDSTKEEIADYIRDIHHSGTHGSYVNLITDSVDVIIVAREPSEDEISLAESLNVSIHTEAIALDAFVFILNTDNPVVGLTVDQIIGIYTGIITNWQEVGGVNVAINPYQRDRNSGSQELMEKLVMQGVPMVDAPLMILQGMMGPINRLETDSYGIGYTVYFFNSFMAPRTTIKLCAVNGIIPDSQTIASGSYRYTTKVFTAIRSTLDINSTAYLLWRWLQTQAGQSVVESSGYVPFTE
jgi:phosphate transport system substrate-binding protein